MRLSGREQENLLFVLVGGPEPIDARDRCHDDHVPAREQAGGRGVPQPVDLVVDGRVLLDVGVRRGKVRLRLVVVVIRNEVLDSVVREKAAQLARELGGERLVRGEHEGRALDLLDGPGNRRALPLPVIPSRAWKRSPRSIPWASAAIAAGWSPAG